MALSDGLASLVIASYGWMGVAAYPSGGAIDTRIPFTLHKALAYGAAARMLLTGDSTETIKGLKLETEFRRMVREDVNPSTTRERELRPI